MTDITTTNRRTRTTLNSIAPEVIYNIFSFLSYLEVYSIRGVCRKFQVMAEYHIYQQIKSMGQTISLKLVDGNSSKKKGTSGTMMELSATNYDAKNRIIEFRPTTKTTLSLANKSTQQWSAYYRLLKIHFSDWFGRRKENISSSSSFEKLNPQDQAMILYHYEYNSSIEKTYELPSWYTSNRNNNVDRYLGDKGFILNMGYHQQITEIDYQLEEAPPLDTLPTSYYGYKSIASTTPMPSPPIMEIKWIRVTLDWVLSGFLNNIHQHQPLQIYKESFITLDDLLAKEGCFKYDPLSEPVLDYIVHQQQESNNQLPASLVKYVHSHTHECHTRLSRLQHMLEGAGVDAQVLWKYTFAKSYVVGNGSLLGEEDVVRRIQDSEEEWRQKKLSLSRRLFINDASNSKTITI
jgi:hypothetical protein